MTDMMNEFLIESTEGLDLIDRHLVTLEARPDDEQLLTEIFRAIHTLKGSCGFYGLDRLERVAHSGENLLSLLRDGQMRFNPEAADGLLSMVDTIRAMLPAIEADGTEGMVEIDAVVARLDALAAADAVRPPASDTATAGDTATPSDLTPASDTATAGDTATPSDTAPAGGHDTDRMSSAPDGGAESAATPERRLGDILVDTGAASREEVERAAAQQGLGDNRLIGDILAEQGAVPRSKVEAAAANQQTTSSVADSTIRVDVRLLDKLMNLVGELVLSRNELVRLADENEDHLFGPPAQRLNLITSELQEGILKTRMQPINSAWARLPRVVRDLSHQLGKDITVEMVGRETELDRTIIEAIKDPLTHIVRNTVDHGIEDPATRLAAGKRPQGTLTLSARHEGEQVNIEISDDGRGIDAEQIRAKALQQGLISTRQAQTMTDAEAIHLIFQPGFSTAETVTNVSGRGVGMDVVKSNVERIGGSIDVRTEVGRGTSFTIKIPLTLAIIPALTVRSGPNRYAIPQVNVLELVRLRVGGEERIEDIHGAPVYRLRGKLLPIVDLRQQLGMPVTELKTTNIAVVKADSLRFGLVVDGIDDNGEIVVKPLGLQVKDLKLFSGATILGDGRVALILDLLGLADRAGLMAASAAVAEVEAQQAAETNEHRTPVDNQALIVLAVGNDERVAISLDEIDRLEEISAAAIERSEGRPVIQYRGAIMPLVDLGQVIGMGGSVLDASKRINVVVCLYAGRTVGLAVDRILDIVHSDGVTITGKPGTVVIDGSVTDIITPSTIIAAALPSLRRLAEAVASGGSPIEAWVDDRVMI